MALFVHKTNSNDVVNWKSFAFTFSTPEKYFNRVNVDSYRRRTPNLREDEAHLSTEISKDMICDSNART